MATKPPVVDRETLYREVWTSPVTDVAPRYGLSDVGLVKICHKLAISVPSRGYWAKVRAGRVMKIPPLPIVKENAREDTGLRPLSEDQVAARCREVGRPGGTRVQTEDGLLDRGRATADVRATALVAQGHARSTPATERLGRADRHPNGAEGGSGLLAPTAS